MNPTESMLTVVLTGLVVVFAVLILLTFLIWAFGKIVTAFSGGSKKAELAPSAVKQEAPVAKSAPVNGGISNEILAVIAAAVASLSDEEGGKRYVVRGVKRVGAGRPVWSTAGLLENTRPF